MPTPKRGDPRRPIALAVSSCRVLGVLLLLACTCAMVPLAGLRRGGGVGVVRLYLPLLIFGGGGAGYLVLAHFVKRRQFWAVVTALVMTSILALVFVAMFVAMAFVVFSVRTGFQREYATWAVLGIYGLITLALAQLVYHLARSIPVLNYAAPDEAHGFDVLPMSVPPIATVIPIPESKHGDPPAR